MTLLLLGAGGLLGQTLKPYLQSADVNWCTITRGRNTAMGDWVHHRNCPLHGEPGRSCTPSVVINAAASWKCPEPNILRRDNFDFPLSVFGGFSRPPELWIQTNSFFNYAFDLNGVDLDPYAHWRRKAATSIEDLAAKKGFHFSEIRLPHLVGGHSTRERMIPALVRALKSDREFTIRQPESYLPVVHVKDAARQLAMLATFPGTLFGRERAWVSDQMTLGEVAMRTATIIGANPSLIRFGREPLIRFPARMLEFKEPTSLGLAKPGLFTFEEMISDVQRSQA